MKETISIKELGWNGDAIATLNRYGCYEWVDEENDIMWEYDPEMDKSRHCGAGIGACIWTDWE